MRMNVGYMWKAVVAGLGAAITSVTAIEAAGGVSWESLAIAAMGAVGTGLATFAKTNTAGGEPGVTPPEPKPAVVSQTIPGYEPETDPRPAAPGLPTAFPQ